MKTTISAFDGVRGFIICIMLMIGLMLAGAASAQLSDKDIADLQRKARDEGWTFTVSQNPATQRSLDELCGYRSSDRLLGITFDPCTPKGYLPANFSWCDSGICTPIKNQGGCGGCWAFATVGPLECNIKWKDGVIVDLSEQWLVSCNKEGWGCNGGGFAHGYHMSRTDFCGDAGAVLESDFPYSADDLPCSCPYPHPFHIDSWAMIGTGGSPSIDAIKQAILDHGPVSVSVYAGSAMSAYTGGIFNACSDYAANHAVVLVGWNDNAGDSGVWIMRNSWGPGWGEDGYMRIEYGCSRIAEAACYIEYSGSPRLAFSYPDGLPGFAYTGIGCTIRAEVTAVYGGTLVPGSTQLYYRIDGGRYTAVTMTELSPGQFEAAFPTLSCGDTVDYYISADEIASGTIYDPSPSSPRTLVVVNRVAVEFADDFETDEGWFVDGDAIMGDWERGLPAGDGQRGDPPTDFDGSGQCYLTDNTWGNSDVDEGTTRLYSPWIHLPAFGGRIHYAAWYYNDYGSAVYGDPRDSLTVAITTDGASWTNVNSYFPGYYAAGGWFESWVEIGDYAQSVDSLRLRFAVADLNEGDIIEAAIDDVYVEGYHCEDGPLTILSSNIRDWTVGVSCLQRFSAWGGLGAVAWEEIGDNLAVVGLSLAANGVLSGIPQNTGAVQFVVRATDEFAGVATDTISMQINPTVTIPATSLPDWTVGRPYGAQLTANGGTGIISWRDKYNTLPPRGLTLGTSGAITGTPTATGDITFVAAATDEPGASDEISLTFTINDAVSVIAPDMPEAEVDSAYSITLQSAGGTPPITWSDKNGDLDSTGLTLSPAGDLTGTPTAAGVIGFTARAEDAAGSADEKELSISVMGPYLCGDANGDAELDIGDAVYLINYIFRGGPAPVPLDAGDANCDGSHDIGDAVHLITHIFKSGPPPCCP